MNLRTKVRSAPVPRIPFADAIASPKLLKGSWEWLSQPQQVILLAAYGQPLRNKRDHELWSAFQGAGIYDHLGYLTGITHDVPYIPKKYETVSAIIGRRASKSTVSCFAAAYEITCGGHTAHVEPEQDIFFLYIGATVDVAVSNSKFILTHINRSPLLSKELPSDGSGVKVDEIHFNNGVVVKCESPNVRTGRGNAVLGWIGDEISFWYKDSRNANPDYEVLRALDSAQDQFPDAFNWRISTPWTPEGVLYQAHRGGTEGLKIKCDNCASGAVCTHVEDLRDEFRGMLVIEAPTAALENPKTRRVRLAAKKRRDPDAFERENLAKFTHSRGSFLSPALIGNAIDSTINVRTPQAGMEYVAVIDSAFRSDSFSFQLWHHDPVKGMVQNYIKTWTPELGEPLNPRLILGQIAPVCQQWGTQTVFSDQNQYDSFAQLAEEYDLSLVKFDITKQSKVKLAGNFLSLLRQGKIRLLNDRLQEAELLSLQKVAHPGGGMSVTSATGKHDDRAMCALLGAYQCLWYTNEVPQEQTGPKDPRQQALLAQFAQQFAEGEMSEAMMQSIRMSEMLQVLEANQYDDEAIVS